MALSSLCGSNGNPGLPSSLTQTELARGKTIITIAHRLSTIEQADQILVVEDGQSAECGTHEELIRKEGKYQQFVKIREKAEGWKIS